MSKKLLTESELPTWFKYPREFLRVYGQGLLDFDPWVVLQGDQLRRRFRGLKERYPNRELVPFARREDKDDVACWSKGSTRIIVIHDFASPGYEDGEEFETFWDWLRSAVEATIEYDGD